MNAGANTIQRAAIAPNHCRLGIMRVRSHHLAVNELHQQITPLLPRALEKMGRVTGEFLKD